MKRLGVLLLVALCGTACGASENAKQQPAAAYQGAEKSAGCPARALPGWKRLARKIKAPVYCPTYMPDPLDGVIGSRWNNINETSPDRSYLESWVWQETGPGAAGGELHVNLRGYPRRTRMPKCVDADAKDRHLIPCFSDPHGTVSEGPITATVYTVNQDADQWHVVYLWRHEGSLYTISEHVAPPLSYAKVRTVLNQILRGLVLVRA